MLAAHALRVINAERIVVSIDSTGSVVELQLKTPLAPELLAKARCYVGPFKQIPVSVTPGLYRGGVFWGSEIGTLEIVTVARPRAQYKRPETCNVMKSND